MTQLHSNNVPFAESFARPASHFRGAPFWSWNGKLDRDELLRQIDVFHEMGIGGVHIHSRTGLDTPYLSDAFMDHARACHEHASAKGMLTWLYDEDRWPSGFAGGLVTEDPQHRQRFLLFTPTPYGQGEVKAFNDALAAGSRTENGELLARFGITLERGRLAKYRVLEEGESVRPGETLWYAYMETANPSPWFNNLTYVDTLSPAAMRRFIEVTHERYKAVLGEGFGKTIPAIFTDEPQFTHKHMLPFAEKLTDLTWPWTPDLDAAFTEQFGESILARFPEVIWDLPDDRPSRWRYLYHEWVAERFAQSFVDQIGGWCQAHGIALTGHMMHEETLNSQTTALGEAMRSYRRMDIPGIDMLCDWEDLTTAKQAQSAARQFGRPGVLSELYGVTGWDFDFRGHKRQGDWQAALGVLYRVHHLSWYSMRGESKRDYPASIQYQSPWWQEYHHVEDHFARVAATLSRGEPVCRVGMIHPIESYWLCAGPNDTSGPQRQEREDHFKSLNAWLIHGLIDFDYLAESLLPELADVDDPAEFGGTFGGTFGGGFGGAAYDVLLVPGMRTIRSTTMDRLEAFADAGGRIVFVGEVPTLVDVEPSDRPAALAARCETVAMSQASVLTALDRHRDIDVIRPNGARADGLVYQMRCEGGFGGGESESETSATGRNLRDPSQPSSTRYLFICRMARDGHTHGTLRIRGTYAVTALDTATGERTPIAAEYADGQTRVPVRFHVADHVVLELTPGEQPDGGSLVPAVGEEVGRLTSPVPVTLDEPNVLLLDTAAYRINDGEWQPEAPLLDIENAVRAAIGMPRQTGQIAQPWTDDRPATTLATITLRLTFTSEVDVTGATFALENLAESTVRFDGQPVDTSPVGYFTDKAILPDFTAGTHTIEIDLAFTKETAIEWCYVLGDFGVRIDGTRGVVVPPVRTLSFGNWTTQGLPFFGGNVTYHCHLPCEASAIRLPQLDGTAVRVTHGATSRFVYRDPLTVPLSGQAGDAIDLKVFGHRANCFGPVHCAETLSWMGPNAYRTTGPQYSPEYQLKPLGIRNAPILYASHA